MHLLLTDPRAHGSIHTQHIIHLLLELNRASSYLVAEKMGYYFKHDGSANYFTKFIAYLFRW
jgi:hypothetical protein